ncbi:MAG: porin [Gammaproteobacteria bacterium]|nr:porin [Gammaproteobacteria bacterium]
MNILRALLAVVVFGYAPWLLAEPYLAIKSGHSCATCHVNPTGGGQRTVFGDSYAQEQLVANPSETGSSWTGTIIERFRIGGNARTGARQFDFDDRDDNLEFGVDRVTLYLSAELNEHVTFYVDQQIAPGTSLNREAWVRLKSNSWSLKAGRIFLPLGWRTEDNTTLVRQATGISMVQGDNGIEVGFDSSSFNFQLTATNGAGGAGEVDDGKLFAARAEWSGSSWRLGASALHNNTDLGDRLIYGVFAGVQTGPVSWLVEYDRIDDTDSLFPDLTQDVASLEANFALARGHNLRISVEAQSFDDNQQDRYRGNIVYEYFPWSFTQVRLGFRGRDSDDDIPALNSNEAFLQLHVFF